MGFIEEYYVNENKKVVVCKLQYCENELICDLCKKGWPGHEALLIQDTFIGKATCSDEDVFDVEKGKKIAFKRAYAKLTNAKKKTLQKFYEIDKKAFEIFTEVCDKMVKQYDTVIERKTEEVNYIVEH